MRTVLKRINTARVCQSNWHTLVLFPSINRRERSWPFRKQTHNLPRTAIALHRQLIQVVYLECLFFFAKYSAQHHFPRKPHTKSDNFIHLATNTRRRFKKSKKIQNFLKISVDFCRRFWYYIGALRREGKTETPNTHPWTLKIKQRRKTKGTRDSEESWKRFEEF